MQKFPFLGFCLMPGNWKKKTFVPVDHFPDFNLESATIIIKNMFIMKNLTDFRKTVETGVNPHLDTRIKCFLGGSRTMVKLPAEAFGQR